MSNQVEIYAINYDFNPIIPYSRKTIWVQLKFPIDIGIGTMVRIYSADPYFIPPDKNYRVLDVVGNRIILADMDYRMWSSHGPHWGYQTRDLSDWVNYRDWNYGRGKPIGYLVW